MGGRNSYSASSKSIVTKQYKTIGFDGKMTYLESTIDRAKDPIRSNSPNPIYVVVDNDGTPKTIYFYKNHKVYKSIDLKHGPGPHAHRWKTVYNEKHQWYSSERVNPNVEHLELTRKENLYLEHARAYLKRLNLNK